MFGNRSVGRMRARREALARDILQIHSDFFMAVYGYRKTHARLIAQGWNPGEVGRDQVMRTMRELGVRGVRRGRTPVATRPAREPETDPYDNTMAESADGAYKTELVWRRKPFQDLRDLANLELATFRRVSWWNSKRLHRSLGRGTPEEAETEYYANQAAQAVSL